LDPSRVDQGLCKCWLWSCDGPTAVCVSLCPCARRRWRLLVQLPSVVCSPAHQCPSDRIGGCCMTHHHHGALPARRSPGECAVATAWPNLACHALPITRCLLANARRRQPWLHVLLVPSALCLWRALSQPWRQTCWALERGCQSRALGMFLFPVVHSYCMGTSQG